ncbi:uncharacterized protein BDZ99DRAFT_509002 [Mytilinidion resinicola]|uniref:Methyltransferase n=1 Tax=Mytilinidion resinicola TaxID=574789 RepID=A0A6A6YLH1_9PEZI|nr:uncharacterized protein BDZ99DRAFT_509002 [Mytilinidion resinicola]KAF2809389.1 hypothetical protein BDZ99DRAFT_509002 [Mytilinidion resinicola]
MTTTTQQMKLKYFQWDEKYRTEKPFQLYADIPAGVPDSIRGNVKFTDGETETIEDVRGQEEKYSLDNHGFAFCGFETDFCGWEEKTAVETEYYRQMEEILTTKVPGADLVHIFEHRLRRSDPPRAPGLTVSLSDPSRYLSPAGTVHKKLLRSRVQVINVWRPLYDVIQNWPLAVCDGSTVASSELVAVDQVRRHSRGDGLVLRYKPGYKWYYLSRMRLDEALLLKNFDSKPAGKAKFAPHTSFRPSNVPRNAPKRTSIEVRALVFSFDQDDK